jgi:hypothetical protein
MVPEEAPDSEVEDSCVAVDISTEQPEVRILGNATTMFTLKISGC